MENLISHSDGKLLEVHLADTCQWGRYFMDQSPGNLYHMFEPGLIEDMLICHDLGKATSFFQEYIRDTSNYCRSKKLKSHSLLSGIIYLWYRIRKGFADQYDNLIAFTAIVHHHSNLTSLIDTSQILASDDEIINLKRQWDSINKDKFYNTLMACGFDDKIAEELLSLDADSLYHCASGFLRTAYIEWRRKLRQEREKESFNLVYYYKLQLLYSLLTDSDKSGVVLGDTAKAARCTHNIDVKGYMAKEGIGHKKTPLNLLRSQAFNSIAKIANNLDLSESRILLLTLPTGMGKTLAIYNFASVLRHRLLKETGKLYRIIYTLPFMSIIDQNAQTLEKILEPQYRHSSMLIKHHHLAPAEWVDEEGSQIYAENSADILFEGWNSEIIITTFVQFLETLIGWTNKKQRKYNKLSNCIVIMDEIQAIPFKYHKLINETVSQYVNLLDSYFIGMTATQPAIFRENEALSLIDSSEYFHKLNRISFHYKAKKTQTISELVNSFKYENKKRYLFILNTIESARRLYSELQVKYPELKIGFVSTHVVPVLRLYRIRKMKKKAYDIVVSTQLIEAGVDVDFDVVYRDLAPLPSLVQSAGRSNRDGEKSGSVIIIQLVSDNGKPFSEIIYGKHSKVDLQETKRLLEDKEQYRESEIYSICEQYFRNLSSGVKNQDDSISILNGMCRGIFSECDLQDVKPVSAFKLIDDDLLKYPVYIEINKHAQILWNRYKEILSNDEMDRWERLSKLKQIRSEMSKYTVNAYEKFFEKHNRPVVDEDCSYYYVQRNQLHLYYDKATGLGVDNSLIY
jgi:CRISPR-associated endonuclease/helicase Cas3